MVFADEILGRDPAFGELAAAVIRELVDAIEDQQAQLQGDLDATSEALAAYPGPPVELIDTHRIARPREPASPWAGAAERAGRPR